ncbi:MAG TPA: hypothetical protein VKM55_11725 [Candidatus Lokiarchaeia archaeon]|nr:hypothetical protein [Candidatus Lokiarchaeia archaeon]
MVITRQQAVLRPSSSSVRKACDLYQEIEKRGGVRVIDASFYKDLVCPKNWKDHPYDRWFKLKEGYSSYMIEHLLKEFGATAKDWVVDPFLGSGSTLVGARNAGVKGAGFEVNPFLAKLSAVKMHASYDVAVLNARVDQLFTAVAEQRSITIESPVLTISEKLFREQFDTLLRIKQEILSEPDENVRNFLLLGLGCVLERCSYARKDGNGLKWRPKKPLMLIDTLKAQYRLMIEDVERQETTIDHVICNADSRQVDRNNLCAEPGDLLEDLVANARFSMFSPPYANCFDYTEVYKIELWMLDFIKDYAELKSLRARSVSSHLNKQYENSFPSTLPDLDYVVDLIPWESTWGKLKMKAMVLHYFDDLKAVFTRLRETFPNIDTLICIVGNSAYGNVPIATDLFLAEYLHDLGFGSVEIRVARMLGTSSQQQKFLGGNPFLRESLVIARP